MKSALPNFRGQRALVLHRSDANRRTLVHQLENLGLAVESLWPAENVSAEGFDVLFFDADLGYDGLFAWPPNHPPIPMVALMGSEAPGRIEWTLAQSPSAYLIKPIGSTGVFSALAIAYRTFERQQALRNAISDMAHRIKARPVVFRALQIIIKRFEISDVAAYRKLRTASMNRRMSVEGLSHLIVTNGERELDRLDFRDRSALRQAGRG